MPQPETDFYGYGNGPSTTATDQHGSNPAGFTPMYIGDWHPPVDDGTDAGGGGDTTGGGGGDTGQAGVGTYHPSDQSVIDALGYDPGDPRNNLTTGFGSGLPTQKGVGTATSIAGNAVFPGLGLATGPLGSWLTRMFQNWAGQRNVNNALNPKGGGGGDSSGGGGGGFDFGKFFGDPGYSSPAYLQSIGYQPGQGTGSLWPAEHGYVPGGRFSPLPGSFAGLGSFSGADPLSGAWGGINSPVARFALGGGQFDPARTPAPGFQWSPAQLRSMGGPATYPGGAPIINPAAFGASTSPGSSAHFNPKANQ